MADVICPQCAGRFHETTGAFVPGEVTTGNMLTLKAQYRDNGWASFPEHAGIAFGGIECPDCGGAYSDDGRVRIDMEQWAKEQGRKEWVGSEPVTVAPAVDKKTETQDEVMQRLFNEYNPDAPVSYPVSKPRKHRGPRKV